MYRNISPFEHPELSQKDIVISTLKKELSELQDIEGDFNRVNDDISKLQSKYTLLIEDKDRNEKEHKLRMDVAKKAITELRTDIDKLKIHIHKTGFQAEEVARENNTLKRIIDNRNGEIDGLVGRNSELEKRNETQLEENRSVAINIKQIKEEKAKLEAECEKIHSLLDGNILQLKSVEKEVRVLESTSSKLDKCVAEAEKDNQQLLVQLKTKQTAITKLNKNLQALQIKTQTQKNKNALLQNDVKRLSEDTQKANATLDIELGKNKELTTKLKSLDNTIRAIQQELEEVITKKQGLKQEHFDLINDNRQLNGDIDGTLVSILDYQKLNAELQKEIENYIETDQQARNLLNRKHAMKSLLQQVNIRLEKTGDQIAHLR